jgi:hypothetical protein
VVHRAGRTEAINGSGDVVEGGVRECRTAFVQNGPGKGEVVECDAEE